MFRILSTNLGYARNIDGSWKQHIGAAHRYLYTSRACQLESLAYLRQVIDQYAPHLTCFLEIDQGSMANGFLDQLNSLTEDSDYISHAGNKYGRNRRGNSEGARGKSNGFLARVPVTHEKHYFRDGFKRLVYEIRFENKLTVFLVHLALSQRIRQKQLKQLVGLIEDCKGEIMIIGDFNIFGGEQELLPLTAGGRFAIVNDMAVPTFRLGGYLTCVDLCLATSGLVERTNVKVLDQPCSDHQMLLIDIDG